jgi:uncharacterized repeat protein (TIGR01451 family)
MEKTVRVDGTKPWLKEVTVAPGTTLNFQVTGQNQTGGNLTDIVVRDVMPEGLGITYIEGTTKLYNSNNTTGMPYDDKIVKIYGTNIGDYHDRGNFAVTYSVKVPEADELNCGMSSFYSSAEVIVGPEDSREDAVTVNVDKVCEVEPEQPVEEPKEPVNTNTPVELSKTGPVSAVAGIVGLGSVATAAGYYVASRRRA